jgi:hypothetical protein
MTGDSEPGECPAPSDSGQEKTFVSPAERSSSGIVPLRALCRGVLHALGMFSLEDLTSEERLDFGKTRTWFGIGEVLMAGLLAACIAVPAFFWCAKITEPSLAFIAAVMIFLPAFVFLPKLIRYAMDADTDAVLIAFGKNEQVRRVFWAVFIGMAGLVLARILDPVTAQQILGAITGMGG